MFVKRFITGFSLLMVVLLSACGAQATPRAQLAPTMRAYDEAAPAPTEAFEANAAPSGSAQAQEERDMFFKNYGVNPAVDTEDDNLSTFALDVDSGAYTVARRYINDGNLPPKDSVRVEEFVNYFDQGYPNPTERSAFGIHVDGASTPFSETERYQTLRIGIQGYAVPANERKDVSLTFVIDVSGSMDMENRLGLVKRSLELLVEQLTPRDRVSIVVFGSSARVVLESTSGRDRETIMNAIQRLQPEGATNAEDGLRLGYKLASENRNPEAINRVILCSDGVANVGDTGAGSIWELIEQNAKENNITLATIGFGMGNYNDVLMEQLADRGDGFYAYVDTIQEAKRLFVQNLTSTLQVIAKDAKVQVEFNKDVVANYRLVGYENRAVADDQFHDNSVDAGEIGAGLSATALYEIKLKPEARGKILTISLRWKDPETNEVVEMSKDFATEEMTESFEQASPYFQWSVAVAEYAEILRESYWAQKSNAGDVLNQARRIADLLPESADVKEFVELVRRANQLSDK